MKASVCLTRYSESDDVLFRCLKSLFSQKNIELEIMILDQLPNKYVREFCSKEKSLKNNIKYIEVKRSSLSNVRNIGIDLAKNNIILYLDCDASADENWAYFLSKSLKKENVAVAGSKIVPIWEIKKPFFANSKVIIEQYSMLDLGPLEKEVKKVIGAGFGIDRLKIGKTRFKVDLGRKEGNLLGGEETDFCDRLRNKKKVILYNGKSIIMHHVSKERINLKWMFKRVFAAGRSRFMRGGNPETFHKKNIYDFIFMPFILAPYLLGFLYQKFLINTKK